MRKRYPTDLSESQSQLILAFFKENQNSVRRTNVLEIFNALCYLCKTGCQWKMLPREFPKWQTVYYYYRSWIQRGWFNELLHILVCKARHDHGKKEIPTVGVIDSCSIKSALPQSEKGIDGNKRIKGIKSPSHKKCFSRGRSLGAIFFIYLQAQSGDCAKDKGEKEPKDARPSNFLMGWNKQ